LIDGDRGRVFCACRRTLQRDVRNENGHEDDTRRSRHWDSEEWEWVGQAVYDRKRVAARISDESNS